MEPNSDIVEKINILLVVVTLVSPTLYSVGINLPRLQHCKCITPVWSVKNCGCSTLTLLSVLFISLALMLSGIMLIILVGCNPFAPLVYLFLMGAAIPYWFTLATFLHPLLWFAFMVVCWLPSCYALFLFRQYVTCLCHNQPSILSTNNTGKPLEDKGHHLLLNLPNISFLTYRRKASLPKR
ncbi:hypothetical protein ACE6H2_002756 [Prunus campanulata]